MWKLIIKTQFGKIEYSYDQLSDILIDLPILINDYNPELLISIYIVTGTQKTYSVQLTLC